MKFRKILALLLALMFCFSSAVSAFAANNEPEINPLYEGIQNVYVTLEDNSGDLAVTATCYTYEDCILKVTITMQKSSNATSWSNYQKFSAVSLSSGSIRTADKTSYDVPAGYYYKAFAYVQVYKGGVCVDSDTFVSDTVYVS